MDMTEKSNSRKAYLRNYMRANTAVNSLKKLEADAAARQALPLRDGGEPSRYA
jgi:hypothetical protein